MEKGEGQKALIKKLEDANKKISIIYDTHNLFFVIGDYEEYAIEKNRLNLEYGCEDLLHWIKHLRCKHWFKPEIERNFITKVIEYQEALFLEKLKPIPYQMYECIFCHKQFNEYDSYIYDRVKKTCECYGCTNARMDPTKCMEESEGPCSFKVKWVIKGLINKYFCDKCAEYYPNAKKESI